MTMKDDMQPLVNEVIGKNWSISPKTVVSEENENGDVTVDLVIQNKNDLKQEGQDKFIVNIKNGVPIEIQLKLGLGQTKAKMKAGKLL